MQPIYSCEDNNTGGPESAAAALPPPPHRDRSSSNRRFTIPQPIAEEEQQQQQEQQESQPGVPISIVGENNNNYEANHHHGSSASAFINSMKNIFAPCVGAVDAASLFMDECRPSKFDTCNTNQHAGGGNNIIINNNNNNNNVAEDVIMRLRERNGAFTTTTTTTTTSKQAMTNKQKRGKTLEIPTRHGMMFDDDDVSAISAHTLEEMELLRMAQKSKRGGISNFHMSPPPTKIWRNSNTKNTNHIIRPKGSRYQHHQHHYQKQHPTISTTKKSAAAASAVQGQGQHNTSPFGSFTDKQILKIQQHHQSSPVFTSHGDLSICVSASESSSNSSSEGIIDMVAEQEKQQQQDNKIHRVG